MNRINQTLTIINSLLSAFITYATFWFEDKETVIQKMETFDWAHLVIAVIVGGFVYFFIWSMKKIAIATVADKIIEHEKQKWNFMTDAIEHLYKDKETDLLNLLITEDEDGRKEFKYDDAFLISLGIDEKSLKRLKDQLGTGNVLNLLMEMLTKKEGKDKG